MLTFLELYQTLLSFVHFKLYTDSGLVYPPPLDAKKDEDGAGVDAFALQDGSRQSKTAKNESADVGAVSGKVVRQTIKSIAADMDDETLDVEMSNTDPAAEEDDEEFVAHPSSKDTMVTATLPTLQALSSLPTKLSTNLFSPYTFFLSRETPRSIFEFVVRAFGGRIGWHPSSGSGSPFDESDPNITHVIIDRPLVEREETATQRELRLRRKYVQPQWIIDCINAGKILLEDSYGQGKTLPPHLSPFGEYEGAYIPGSAIEGAEDDEEEEAEEEDHEMSVEKEQSTPSVLDAITSAANDEPTSLRAAELAAEAAGVDYGTFEAAVKQAKRKERKSAKDDVKEAESDMNKMMMSNKQRKLYEKMKYSNQKKQAEVRSNLLFQRHVYIAFFLFTESRAGEQKAGVG